MICNINRYRAFCERFCKLVCIKIRNKISWKGKGIDEIGIDQNGKTVVAVHPRYFRPSEVESLLVTQKKLERN